MLIMIIEVIGKKTLLFSFSIRISPGNFPNQLNNPGKKYKRMPAATRIIPAIINHRDINDVLVQN